MPSLITCCGVALALVSATARGDGRAGDPQRIDAGRRIYTAQCAACHGPRGEGQPDWDRPNAAGELPAPPHDREGHTWKHSDAMLYRLVKDGWRDPYNKTPRLTMPAFGQTLAPGEIHDVIEYLKTMWTPDQRSFQQEESRQAPFPPEAR
jgi:mono/diheme cytochrome c family protein